MPFPVLLRLRFSNLHHSAQGSVLLNEVCCKSSTSILPLILPDMHCNKSAMWKMYNSKSPANTSGTPFFTRMSLERFCNCPAAARVWPNATRRRLWSRAQGYREFLLHLNSSCCNASEWGTEQTKQQSNVIHILAGGSCDPPASHTFYSICCVL